MSPTCGGCDRALRDGFLCTSCRNRLVETLIGLPFLLDELITTAYRQDRVVVPGGGRGNGERPLPFKVHAARLLAEVRVILWSFNDNVGLRPDDHAICGWLKYRTSDYAKTNPEAGRMYAAVIDAADRIHEAIDLPKSLRYLGRCDACSAELYADRSAEVWPCQTPDCNVLYDVKARMVELVERSRDVVAPTSTIATALTSLEYPVTEELIRKWSSRGLLTARTNAGRARWYRLGDVLDLLLRQRTKEASKT